MKLINVRKGQFVYYNNELHKVYSIKPFFKQSVHLVRIRDFEQAIVTAKEITYYRPKHLDSFICIGQRYTLDKAARAKIGDYILVINPRPDSLDHHHLHAIELVSSMEENGVISNKSNGIKHTEYWVMTPGLLDRANVIDQLERDESEESSDYEPPKESYADIAAPVVGQVYQKNDSNPVIQAMVVAIEGRTVYLGTNIKVQSEEITDTDKWSLVLNVRDQ